MEQKDCPVKISYWQKYFSRAHCIVSLAYEFKGKLDVSKMQEATNLIYKHHQVLKYNLHDNNDMPIDNDYVKNTEEFQELLDKQEKSTHLEIKDLKAELTYLHNSSWEQLLFDNDRLLPLKQFILTGYKEDEFCLFFIYDHVFLDATGMFIQSNEIINIYSKLVRGDSIADNIKILEERTSLNEREVIEKYVKIPFWRCFINTIKTIRPKLGDPGKLQLDTHESVKIMEEQYYPEAYKRENTKPFQMIENYDYTEIFETVRKTHPQVSRNSILVAFWYRFFDHYSMTVRAKELNVDPETLRGPSAGAVAYRNIDPALYAKHAGNFVASLNINYDPRNFNSLEEFALKIHNDTQSSKKNHLGLTNQIVNTPFFCNYDITKSIIDANYKSTFLSTNWTNFYLNNNTKMLEGAEYIRNTIGMAHGRTPGKPDYPNLFPIANCLVFSVGPKNDVSHIFSTMNLEQNVRIMDNFKQYHEDQTQFYSKQPDTGSN